MTHSRVVLVVHGIANRDPMEFESDVAALGARIDADVRPVFWGDLGVSDTLVSLTSDASEALPASTAPTAPTAPTRDANRATEATAARIRERVGAEVPDSTMTVLRDVINDAADSGRDVQRGAVQDALADAVVLTGPTGSARLRDAPDDADAREHQGWAGDVKAGLRRIVDAVDASLDKVTPERLSLELRESASGLSRSVARTVGDVLLYDLRGSEIRARLDVALRQALDDGAERIDVLAHSLGGLVAVEYLLGAPVDGSPRVPAASRHIHTFVTFGSQVALFCEIRGLQGEAGLSSTAGPVALSLPIRRWCNVWHVLDPLAFVVGPVVSVTGTDGPLAVEDFRLEVEGIPTSFSFHSSYWSDERFLAWLANVG